LLSAICMIDFSSQVPCSSTDITSYSDED